MKRILGVFGVAAILVVAVPLPAFAGVELVGWFTRNPAASAPDGGIQVANAPDGMVSYGAISVFEEGDAITRATLTLTESGQALNASGATIRACVAAGSFPSGRQTLTDGPKADCAVGSVELTRSPEGVWTADVRSVLVGEKPALAVVPAEGAGVFQVSFAVPDLVVEADEASGGSGTDPEFDASEFGGTSGGDSPSPSSSSFDDFSGSSGTGSTSGGSFSESFDSTAGGSTFEPAPFGSTVPAPDAAPTPEAPIVDAESTVEGETAMPTRRNLAGTTASSSDTGGSGKQFLFFVLAAAVIGTGAAVGRNRFVTARA